MNFKFGFNISRLVILSILLVISVCIAIFSPQAFIGILVGVIIGYYIYPRSKDIQEWIKGAMKE